MRKETAPARSSPAPAALGSSGAAKSANRWVTNGREYTAEEIKTLKAGKHLKLSELMKQLPGRTAASVSKKRGKVDAEYRLRPFTRGEDEEIRVLGKRTGPTGIRKVLPHRTITEIRRRAEQLGVQLYNYHDQPLKVLGEPLADAIRMRAREAGISMRALDRELRTGGYFTNVAAHRVSRGTGAYMPAILKGLEFFEAELVTAPDGAMTIDWKDE
jgi:hypothetical protein